MEVSGQREETKAFALQLADSMGVEEALENGTQLETEREETTPLLDYLV